MKPAARIAHIVADGRAGGGSTMVTLLLDWLQAQGGSSLTLISQPGSTLEVAARERGIAFVGIDLFSSPFDPTPPWRLSRALGVHRFELTHLHGLRAAHHAVRWPLRSRLGRLVYTVHGLHQLQQAPWIRTLANLAERQVMARVDSTVFVSRADLAAAQRWRLLPAWGGAQVIPNGVDLAALATVGGATKDLDAVFVGRHTAQKQPQLAARVLARLAHAGWRCAMAGGGDEADATKALLRTLPGGERVEHVGELDHVGALRCLARARVVLMPSLWEGLPVLPMEAMALGTVVVASHIAGTDEVIVDGVSGLLVPPGDCAAMDEATRSLLLDERRLAALAAAGRQRAARSFDINTCFERYRQVYAPLLSPG